LLVCPPALPARWQGCCGLPLPLVKCVRIVLLVVGCHCPLGRAACVCDACLHASHLYGVLTWVGHCLCLHIAQVPPNTSDSGVEVTVSVTLSKHKQIGLLPTCHWSTMSFVCCTCSQSERSDNLQSVQLRDQFNRQQVYHVGFTRQLPRYLSPPDSCLFSPPVAACKAPSVQSRQSV